MLRSFDLSRLTVRPVFLAVGLALVLAGCAETNLLIHTAKQAKEQASPPSVGTFKVGSPYQIKGVWYYPKEDWDYRETGIASWYGPGFHGKTTANGETYDQTDLTAAHRTLPMPSVVRVTNLENGRSLVVRINDRGPFAHGRIIDMSQRGAQLLGFERQGTARVRVELLESETRAAQAIARGDRVLPPPDPTAPQAPPPTAAPSAPVQVAVLTPPPGATQTQTAAPAPAPVVTPAPTPVPVANDPVVTTVPVENTKIYIQAGAFQSAENARSLTGRLGAAFSGAHVQQAEVEGRTFYRVRIGPIDSVAAADRLLDRVIVAGYPGSRIVVD